jgi:hypothetical protein
VAKPTGKRTLPEVEAWLTHQGFALEHETARVFQQAGFTVWPARTYVDPAEQKLREIDVVAELILSRSPAHIYAAVECKASAIGAWVIRESDLPFDEDLWLPIATSDVTPGLAGNLPVVAACLPIGNVGTPLPFAIVEAVDNGDRDAAYWAISQAVSAAWGWIGRLKEPSIALPLVVVDTPLYALRYGHDGNPQVTEAETRRMAWPYRDPHGPAEARSQWSTAVDVVARSALTAHVGDLRFRFEWLANDLLKKGMPQLGQRRAPR